MEITNVKIMKDLAIFGVGGFGREVLTLINDINKIENEWNIIGFFDDAYKKGEIINGIPILGSTDDLNSWKKEIYIVVAIGDPKIKHKVTNKISNSYVKFPTVIHPTVIIGDTDYVKIGKGCIICAGNIITTNVEIKDFVILNLACTVGHDTIIGNYASFMPTCNISGEVLINDSVYCGTGVKIINKVEIGENSIIGAGAVVTSSQPDNCTIVGVPAKVIKKMIN